MSIENQLLHKVQKFMNYHYPDIPRTLPPVAQVEYRLLREIINAHLAPKPVVKKAPAKKRKVSKKARKKK